MNDDVHSVGGLYTLDALDDLDRQRFERHAEQCEECKGEVAEFHQTIGRIAATDAEMAPTGMKVAVLDQIARTAQLPARRATTVPAVRRRWVATGLLATASVVLIASLGLALVRSRSELNDSRDLVTVLADPSATSLAYTGVDGTVARLVSSPKDNHLVVLLGGLKAVAADRAYELWMINDDGPTAMGVVHPNTDGSARFVIDQNFDGFVSFGITEEAASGSPVPTSNLVVSGGLRA
jgi:anti-sigma-K factor RskA